MKIKPVIATWIHVPIPEAKQHASDFGAIAAFDTALVRVETESGLVGYGEGRASVFSSGNNAPLVSLINEDPGLRWSARMARWRYLIGLGLGLRLIRGLLINTRGGEEENC